LPETEFPKTTTLKIRKYLVKDEIRKGRGGESGAASADRLVNIIARVTAPLSGWRLSESSPWPRRGRVTVSFGEPLRFTSERPDEIVAMAQEAVLRLAGKNRG
jgi:hypothetical protein